MNRRERESQFEAVFHKNKARLQRVCFGYLGCSEHVEDLFQEIMTNVWYSLPSFRGEASIDTWVYRIAVNTALVYRKKWRHGEELSEITDPARGAQHHLEEEERLVALRKAIATLPDQDRVIVTLLLEGLSYKEISEITGISVNYVGVKLNRIKQALEERLTEVSRGAF